MKRFNRTVFLVSALLVFAGGAIGLLVDSFTDLPLVVHAILLIIASGMSGLLMVSNLEYSCSCFFDRVDSSITELSPKTLDILAMAVVVISMILPILVCLMAAVLLHYLNSGAKNAITISIIAGLGAFFICPALVLRSFFAFRDRKSGRKGPKSI